MGSKLYLPQSNRLQMIRMLNSTHSGRYQSEEYREMLLLHLKARSRCHTTPLLMNLKRLSGWVYLNFRKLQINHVMKIKYTLSRNTLIVQSQAFYTVFQITVCERLYVTISDYTAHWEIK